MDQESQGAVYTVSDDYVRYSREETMITPARCSLLFRQVAVVVPGCHRPWRTAGEDIGGFFDVLRLRVDGTRYVGYAIRAASESFLAFTKENDGLLT